MAEAIARGHRTFWRTGDGKAHERAACIRCGIERQYNGKRKTYSPTGLCRDCRAVDPTFGQQPKDVAS